MEPLDTKQNINTGKRAESTNSNTNNNSTNESTSQKRENTENFKEIKWHEPKATSNIEKDNKSGLRTKVRKLINSELFNITPKILSVFGIWFSLTGLMKIGEKGLKETIKNIIAPIGITFTSLIYDYFAKPALQGFVETPVKVPKVDIGKDLCISEKNVNNIKRALKLFMGDTTNYLGKASKTQKLHGTNRDGLLILAGPPGNGKTAFAHGIGNLANKPIHTLKVPESSTSYAIEKAFKEAHKKGCILFIDEADAIIRGRGDKVTQSFLETFNRYQRENPVRVILATNCYRDMDSAIQSRGYVLNFSNPDLDLKFNIFKKKIQEQNLEVSSYANLLEENMHEVKSELRTYDLSGRDIDSIVKDLKVIAEMRISNLLISANSKSIDALDPSDACIKLEDLKMALKEFCNNKMEARGEFDVFDPSVHKV